MRAKSGLYLARDSSSLSLVIIILAFVIPSQAFFANKANDQVASSQLLRAMNLARSEAIMRNESVTLWKSHDQKTCGGEWQEGYLIFVMRKYAIPFAII